jgi:DNA uptake protein ComE-like DNA-binding protein
MTLNLRRVVPAHCLALFLGSSFLAGSGSRAEALPKDPTPAATPAATVDLNSASEKELEGLSGVGAATAKKIIAGRPYASVDDLAKAGISASTIAKIKPHVTVGTTPAAPATASAAAPPAPAPTPKPAKAPKATAATTPAAPVDLNSASEKDLEELNGVGSATARKIIAGRPYATVDDLAKAGVSASTIAKIKPHVAVGPAPAATSTATTVAPPAPVPVPAATPKPAKAPKPTPTPSVTTTTPATPPQPGMVWANTSTKVFHREGDRYYGNTKHGKWMAEGDALKAGFHEAQTGGTPKAPGN